MEWNLPVSTYKGRDAHSLIMDAASAPSGGLARIKD